MPALHFRCSRAAIAVLKAAMNAAIPPTTTCELVRKVRAANPDVALTDIIVGFPGETEEDFEATANLVDTVGYHQVFTFIYSKREGTPAAKMDRQYAARVIQRRFDALSISCKKAPMKKPTPTAPFLDFCRRHASKRDNLLQAGKARKM